jgi:DNA-binding LytR/AlgR family response regulator
MTVLIVEDEPLAAGILEDYVRQAPFLQLVGRCSDAFSALELLRETPVAVLLLDIHLPGLKGLEFLRALNPRPQTILTTSYQEYAIESYELGVVDYLLKPIAFERFIMAIQKLKPQKQTLSERPFRFFNANKKMVRIWLDEVLYAESLKEYTRLFLSDGSSLMTKTGLSEMEQLLGEDIFLRIHRSFLVAKNRVRAYTALQVILEDGKVLPLGRLYKEQVQMSLGGKMN